MDQPIQRHPVPDHVPHPRPGSFVVERMLVNPEEVRAFDLLIHKPPARLPLADSRTPPGRNPANTETVIDQRPGPHLDRAFGGHSQPHCGRGDDFQIPGVGKERKHLADRARNRAFGLKDSFWHALQVVPATSTGPAIRIQRRVSTGSESPPWPDVAVRIWPVLSCGQAQPRPLRRKREIDRHGDCKSDNRARAVPCLSSIPPLCVDAAAKTNDLGRGGHLARLRSSDRNVRFRWRTSRRGCRQG